MTKGEDQIQLNKWLAITDAGNTEKVKAITEIYNRCGVDQLALDKMQEYYDKAYKNLDSIDVPEHKKLQLRAFADMVSKRAK